jgi:hypothetical protein
VRRWRPRLSVQRLRVRFRLHGLWRARGGHLPPPATAPAASTSAISAAVATPKPSAAHHATNPAEAAPTLAISAHATPFAAAAPTLAIASKPTISTLAAVAAPSQPARLLLPR